MTLAHKMNDQVKRFLPYGLLALAIVFIACAMVYAYENLRPPADETVISLFEQAHPDTKVTRVEHMQEGVRFAGFKVIYSKGLTDQLFERTVLFQRPDGWQIRDEAEEKESH